MSYRIKFHKIEPYLTFISKIGGVVSFSILIISFFIKLFDWGQTWIFPWLIQNIYFIWLLSLTFFLISIFIYTYRLNLKFNSCFIDNFKEELGYRWDYVGEWKIPEPGLLKVRNSDPGGITKVGALWENYTLSFSAKIVNKCIGVIIRAEDLDNYYMIQINPDKIRPHRRMTHTIVDENQTVDNNKTSKLRNEPGWVIMDEIQVPLKPILEGWFFVKIVVYGQSIKLYINDELNWHRDSFLQNSMGKIGFRNWDDEEAHIKNVKVTLQV